MVSSTSRINLYIDESSCRACSRCLARAVCKVKAIVYIDRDEPPYVDMHRCHGCLLCQINCPFGAVKNRS